MGWVKVLRAKYLLMIWDMCRTSTSMDTHRDNVMKRMRAWSLEAQVPIETGLYYLKVCLEANIKVQFNPGVPMETYQTADKEDAPLMQQLWANNELDVIRVQERVGEITRATRTYREYVCLDVSDPRAPPENYYETKVMVVSQVGLISTLLERSRPLYIQLYELWKALDKMWSLSRGTTLRCCTATSSRGSSL